MSLIKYFLSLAILLSAPAILSPAAQAQNVRWLDPKFEDANEHWAALCIQGMGSEGLMKGYLDGLFRPEGEMTRAEFAAVIIKAFPEAPAGRAAPDFLDVADDYWGKGASATAYEKGFLSGYPGNTFKPAQAITRAQAMTVVANAQGLANNDSVTDSEALLQAYFTDASAIPNYARSLIATAADQGLTINYPSANQLRPNANITRGEATALLCRQNAAGTDARYYVPAQYVAGWNADSDSINLSADNVIHTFGNVGVAGFLHTTATIGNQLFFFFEELEAGSQMWTTDGTATGTVFVQNLDDGKVASGSNHPEVIANSEQTFWLNAERYNPDGLNDVLWRSDGTSTGTNPLFDLSPELDQVLANANSINLESKALFKNRFPFTVSENIDWSQEDETQVEGGGTQLWWTDGETAEGTQQIATFYENFAPSPGLFAATDSYLFFQGQAEGGAKLWRSDGTADGTIPLKNMILVETTAQQDRIYINATTVETGEELWTSDGTEAGTQLLRDIYPGNQDSNPILLTNVGDSFFTLANSDTGFELWATDGTRESTRRVKQLSSYPTVLPEARPFSTTEEVVFVEHQNKLFFSVPVEQEEPTGYGFDARYELWVSDGTESGTQRLANTRVSLEGFTAYKGQLFFSGNGPEGRELWKTDGSVAGTHPVIDLIPGVFYRQKSCPAPPPELDNENYCPPDELPIDSLPRSLTVHGDWLYFISDNGDIFRTDGTAKGIQHIHRFEGWPYNDFPPNMVRLGDKLLVMGVADDVKLWALPE